MLSMVAFVLVMWCLLNALIAICFIFPIGGD